MSDLKDKKVLEGEYNRLLQEEEHNVEKDVTKQVQKIKDSLTQRQAEIAKIIAGPMAEDDQAKLDDFKQQLDQIIQNLDLFSEHKK
ncbi:hypothetical protein [Convivina praedatoris]|uniref:Uncharacterized protein n=1 Tax=Convivina praedatoris TaxID=2880963 RepID=A0ABM9D3I1_9LACO|nr:hypothetical protein [Convivina sp. LMG 32447]CAH1856888.1 hypothetical protein R077815_01490 [Convivina sp. LMG 32447]CAH1857177.1 hypothetical protein R078138_01522 [Convivina sp. LMG 32447]CAH1857407.1 hypothetical protein LMG032447_01522 [Convivina sp. LMG 32447]